MNGLLRSRLTLLLTLAVGVSSAVAQQTPASDSKPATPAAEELPDGPTPQPSALIHPSGPTVVFDTSMGRIICQVYDKQAPNAVANFVGLATGTKDWTDPVSHKKMHGKRLYDGTTFHRVIPDFMIQGGDPQGDGAGDVGVQFPDEFDPNLNFDVPGRLAMANSGPDTNASQFFITEHAYDSLNQHYTLFGQCDEDGITVVKAIARVDRDGGDKPLAPVILRHVTIVKEGDPIPTVEAVDAAAAAAAKPAAAATHHIARKSTAAAPKN